MEKIEGEFKYKGVDFKVLKRGKKALLLSASAPFYNYPSLEVWKLRLRKESKIQGNVLPKRERKPSNDDYPMYAKQFFENRYNGSQEMERLAMEAFNKFENQ